MNFLINQLLSREDCSIQQPESFRGFDDMPIALYVTNSEGYITYFNPAAAKLWGRTPELHRDRWCGALQLFAPDGKFIPHDQCPMAEAIRMQHPVRGIEAIAVRPDGSRFRFLPFPTPVHDAVGCTVGAVNMLVYLREEPDIVLNIPVLDMVDRITLN